MGRRKMAEMCKSTQTLELDPGNAGVRKENRICQNQVLQPVALLLPQQKNSYFLLWGLPLQWSLPILKYGKCQWVVPSPYYPCCSSV